MARVEVKTALGSFIMSLAENRAPVTCGYVLGGVSAGLYDGSSVFRIVTASNQGPEIAHKIEVVQMGQRPPTPLPEPVITHEGTASSGLSHRRFTVSLARFAPGAAYQSFFVCLRDEPALDEGGLRHADGRGFAAFGAVEDGFDTVERIYARAEPSDFLQAPIPLLTARVVR